METANETASQEQAPKPAKRRVFTIKDCKEKEGKVRLVNVTHEDIGGFDYNRDGKIDPAERFDARNGMPIEVTVRRAEALLRHDTAGEFWPAELGVAEYERREKKRQELAAKERDRRRRGRASE